MFSTLQRWRVFAVVTLLTAIIHPTLYGEEFFFESRDIAGLTVPSIRDIAEDHLGYIWAATPGGVIRCDGHLPVLWDREKFLSIESDSRTVLPSEDILSLEFETEKSTLWIGTDAGMIGLNLIEDSVEEVRFARSGNRISSLQILDIEVNTGSPFFALTADGVYIRDENGVMTEVPVMGKNGISSASVVSLASDCNDFIWAVSDEGLKIWNPVESRFDHHLDLPDLQEVACIDDSLWLGSKYSTVYNYFPNTDVLNTYPVPGAIMSFAGDGTGRIWMASATAGLSILYPDTGLLETCVVDNEHPYRLSSPKIETLYHSGNLIWVGSVDSGLYSVDIRKKNYLAYTSRSGTNSLPNGPIRSISEDSLGYLWIGSDIGGLARIDTLNGEVKPYMHDTGDYFSIGSDHITSILADSTGRIWVGTDEGPALYISEIEGFEPPELMMGGWPNLQEQYVIAVAESGDGSIWTSLRDGRLFKLDPIERDFRMFPFSSSTVPKVLHADRFGSLWAGSRSNLWLFRNDGFLVRTWILAEDMVGSQLRGGIEAIYSDSRDRHWLGGAGGLTIYNPAEEKFRPVYLPGDRNIGVSGITEDTNGNIWIANGRELHIFDADLHYQMSVGAEAGFTPAGFIGDLKRGRNGDILVGANGELWIFDQVPVSLSHTMPDVQLVSVSVGGTPVLNAYTAVSESELVIKSDENSLGIEFGTVSFGPNEKIRYQYRLDGVDKEWLISDNHRQIHYANLPYKGLTLLVRSYNIATGVVGTETVLDISVSKPFFRRWWAILLYIAVTAAIVVVIIRLREGELLRGQVHALEEARSEALKANQKLEIQSMNDTLSGLLNRRGFDRAIEHALSTASRNDLMISLFMMDVDFFKRYNDNYGHVKGDEVLRGVGRALRSVFGRSTDIIARYGGEEFAVVFVGVNPDAMVTLANELLMAIISLDIVHEYSEVSDRLTLSIGSATIKVTGDLTAEALVELSDKALYAAKDGGRKSVCYTGIIPNIPELMENGTAPIVLDVENQQ